MEGDTGWGIKSIHSWELQCFWTCGPGISLRDNSLYKSQKCFQDEWISNISFFWTTLYVMRGVKLLNNCGWRRAEAEEAAILVPEQFPIRPGRIHESASHLATFYLDFGWYQTLVSRFKSNKYFLKKLTLFFFEIFRESGQLILQRESALSIIRPALSVYGRWVTQYTRRRNPFFSTAPPHFPHIKRNTNLSSVLFFGGQ